MLQRAFSHKHKFSVIWSG